MSEVSYVYNLSGHKCIENSENGHNSKNIILTSHSVEQVVHFLCHCHQWLALIHWSNPYSLFSLFKRICDQAVVKSRWKILFVSSICNVSRALRSTAVKRVGKQLTKTTPTYDSLDKNAKVLPDIQRKLLLSWFYMLWRLIFFPKPWKPFHTQTV